MEILIGRFNLQVQRLSQSCSDKLSMRSHSYLLHLLIEFTVDYTSNLTLIINFEQLQFNPLKTVRWNGGINFSIRKLRQKILNTLRIPTNSTMDSFVLCAIVFGSIRFQSDYYRTSQ